MSSTGFWRWGARGADLLTYHEIRGARTPGASRRSARPSFQVCRFDLGIVTECHGRQRSATCRCSHVTFPGILPLPHILEAPPVRAVTGMYSSPTRCSTPRLLPSPDRRRRVSPHRGSEGTLRAASAESTRSIGARPATWRSIRSHLPFVMPAPRCPAGTSNGHSSGARSASHQRTDRRPMAECSIHPIHRRVPVHLPVEYETQALPAHLAEEDPRLPRDTAQTELIGTTCASFAPSSRTGTPRPRLRATTTVFWSATWT